MSTSSRLVFSGVNGATGEYLRAPLTLDDAQRPRATRRAHRGPIEGVDGTSLAESGWGVIFAPDTPPEVSEALTPLLRHRQEQAGALFKCLRFAPGDEEQRRFLDRHGVGPGSVDPKQLPYYLLIVGSPESVPFASQYQLGGQYAVGRIQFERTDQYEAYARSVVEAESAPAASKPTLTFFGPRHPDDVGTQATHADLLPPLRESMVVRRRAWRVDAFYGDAASKSALSALLGGDRTPNVLMTAGHGVWYWPEDARQLLRQGALVCSGWPGRGAVAEEHSFAADDLAPSARLTGLIAFLVGCFTIGTPEEDAFAHLGGGERVTAAPRAFVSRLAQALLGRPSGALAVIGHVDKAMLSGFRWPGTTSNVQAFEGVLRGLSLGHPVGMATSGFSARHAELAKLLTELLEPGRRNPPRPEDLEALWAAHHDARAYAVFGDPAVRIRVAKPPRVMR